LPNRASAAATLIEESVPVILALPVSVAVNVCVPPVLRVTEKLCIP